MRCFLFYIDDWLSSKNVESMDAHEERGYLRLLLRAATEPDCGLPDDDAQLAIISMLGKQWYKPSKDPDKRIGVTSGDKLRKCFYSENGRLYNERLLKEWHHQQEVRQKRAEAGKRGGRPRAPEKQLVSTSESKRLSKRKANGKQIETNDVCVSGLGFSKEKLPYTAGQGPRHGWVETESFAYAKFRTTNWSFLLNLVQAAEAAKPGVTDAELAEAMRETLREDQYSPNLWLSTVPQYLAQPKPKPKIPLHDLYRM